MEQPKLSDAIFSFVVIVIIFLLASWIQGTEVY